MIIKKSVCVSHAPAADVYLKGIKNGREAIKPNKCNSRSLT